MEQCDICGSSLEIAAAQGDLDTVRLLLDYGINVDQPGVDAPCSRQVSDSSCHRQGTEPRLDPADKQTVISGLVTPISDERSSGSNSRTGMQHEHVEAEESLLQQKGTTSPQICHESIESDYDLEASFGIWAQTLKISYIDQHMDEDLFKGKSTEHYESNIDQQNPFITPEQSYLAQTSKKNVAHDSPNLMLEETRQEHQRQSVFHLIQRQQDPPHFSKPIPSVNEFGDPFEDANVLPHVTNPKIQEREGRGIDMLLQADSLAQQEPTSPPSATAPAPPISNAKG
ncbi:MAG: hypothetical protein Q9220_003630 [cf. Caloplaca sp. 1 TL-2023]